MKRIMTTLFFLMLTSCQGETTQSSTADLADTVQLSNLGDGTWKAKCADGRTETATDAQVLHNDVCKMVWRPYQIVTSPDLRCKNPFSVGANRSITEMSIVGNGIFWIEKGPVNSQTLVLACALIDDWGKPTGTVLHSGNFANMVVQRPYVYVRGQHSSDDFAEAQVSVILRATEDGTERLAKYQPSFKPTIDASTTMDYLDPMLGLRDPELIAKKLSGTAYAPFAVVNGSAIYGFSCVKFVPNTSSAPVNTLAFGDSYFSYVVTRIDQTKNQSDIASVYSPVIQANTTSCLKLEKIETKGDKLLVDVRIAPSIGFTMPAPFDKFGDVLRLSFKPEVTPMQAATFEVIPAADYALAPSVVDCGASKCRFRVDTSLQLLVIEKRTPAGVLLSTLNFPLPDAAAFPIIKSVTYKADEATFYVYRNNSSGIANTIERFVP